jgi:uncharacterized membrane protein YgdD (TMEM256/DUF423 family)
MKSRFPLLTAGILGATGIALGAFGAHALEPMLVERGTLHAWETAARYHVIHAVAVFGAALWELQAPATVRRWARWSTLCWLTGTLLFSGSLYLLAVGGPRWLGPITPLGGLALLAGWGCVVLAAFTRSE